MFTGRANSAGGANLYIEDWATQLGEGSHRSEHEAETAMGRVGSIKRGERYKIRKERKVKDECLNAGGRVRLLQSPSAGNQGDGREVTVFFIGEKEPSKARHKKKRSIEERIVEPRDLGAAPTPRDFRDPANAERIRLSSFTKTSTPAH